MRVGKASMNEAMLFSSDMFRRSWNGPQSVVTVNCLRIKLNINRTDRLVPGEAPLIVSAAAPCNKRGIDRVFSADVSTCDVTCGRFTSGLMDTNFTNNNNNFSSSI